MKKYKNKATKFSEAFKLIEDFEVNGVYLLPSYKSKVLDVCSKEEQELYHQLWNENFDVNREYLTRNILEGNDSKFRDLTLKTLNFAQKAFKNYISDKNGIISLSNHIEIKLDDKLDEIKKMKEELDSFPEYSSAFDNTNKYFNIFGFEKVRKIEPVVNDRGFISNAISGIEFNIEDDLKLEEGLYEIPELNNFRFDINSSSFGDYVILELSIEDRKMLDKFIKTAKSYINDFDEQLNELNNSNKSIRYSIYDVYSQNELL